MKTTKNYSELKDARNVVSNGALFIVLISILFNSFLAMINAHATRLNQGHVMITEVLILTTACWYIWKNTEKLSENWESITFLYIIIILFFWMIYFNYWPNIKSIRDMILIPIFLILGRLAEEKGLIKMMRILTIILVGFMLMEGWFTEIYVYIFQPASYYANTRGIQELSTDSSGLFRNSLGFAGRFSYGIIGSHRLSSLMLEQVSFANFSMILGLFSVAFWEKLTVKDRLLFTGSILLIILGNSTRTGSIFALILLFGYYIFPLTPRLTPILYSPLLLASSLIVFFGTGFHIETASDDMQGRVGATIYKLVNTNWQTLFTGDLSLVASAMDSGYIYLIFSQTAIGLIAFWLYTALIVPAVDAETKRFANGLGVFIAINLMIGAGIFTIKVAAPLWFIAGHLMNERVMPKMNGNRSNIVKENAQPIRS
jgi:putative polymerase